MNYENPWYIHPRQSLPIKMKLTGPEKNIIKKDWAPLLLDMKSYPKTTKMVFLRRVGPLGIGVFLSTKNFLGSYSVVYQVYNLTLEKCLPNLSTMIDGSGLHWEHHKKYYQQSARLLKEQAWIPVDGPLSLDDIFNGFVKRAKDFVKQYKDNYEESLRMIMQHNGGDEERAKNKIEYGSMGLYGYPGAPAMIAAWAGDQEKAKEYLEWACKVHNFRDNAFRENLEKLISDPEKLREIARNNIKKFKFEYAPYQDIVDVPYKETWPK